jgi:hypothetical protein
VHITKELYCFWLIGQILRERAEDSISFGELAQSLSSKWREISTGTVRNFADRIEAFFRRLNGDVAWRPVDQVRLESVAEQANYFDRRKGKPFRIYAKGWSAWEKTDEHFKLIEGTSLESSVS